MTAKTFFTLWMTSTLSISSTSPSLTSSTNLTAKAAAVMAAGAVKTVTLQTINNQAALMGGLYYSYLSFYSAFNALMELIIAIMETPTSAKTAAHMLASPTALSISTRSLIPRANTIYCFPACWKLFLFIQMWQVCIRLFTKNGIRGQ